MTIPPASAVTWSMTSQGCAPHRSIPIRCCLECGMPFTPTFHTNKICSDTCRERRAKRIACYKHTCQGCGCRFSSYKKTSKFCSDSCKYRAKKIEIERCCSECGRPFQVPKNNPRRKTCSRECHRARMVRSGSRSLYFHGLKKEIDILETYPENRCKLTPFLAGMPMDQLDKTWIPAIVYHFCEGRRGELSEVLQAVRDRYRSAMLNAEKVKEAPSNAQAP